MQKNKKLVLFDIDGTLVMSDARGVEYWKKRLNAAFDAVHNKPITFEIDIHEFNGKVDKQVMWLIADRLGISKADFEKKLDQTNTVFHEYLKTAVEQQQVTYWAIKEAKTLLDLMVQRRYPYFGLITGNVEKSAWLKLDTAGFGGYFSYGVFGDRVDSRPELVKMAMRSAPTYFGADFGPRDIVVVGDTVHDIRAAKESDVIAIGVATGHTGTAEDLVNAGADIVTTSLMDTRVLKVLGIE